MSRSLLAASVLTLLAVGASAQPTDQPPSTTLEVSQPDVRAHSPLRSGADEAWQSGPPIRIIEVYQDGGSTKFVIQSRKPLVTGRPLYLGLREEQATLGPLLSRTGDLHYYAASAPGKLRVQPGDTVRFQKTEKLALPAAVLRALSASHGYEQKSVAEITAVQDDRLMIDKGTLHEIHERDLYRIIDASGTPKGMLEVRGIGDLQSSAIFYNLKGARTGAGLSAQPGDYAVYLGQRRLFGLGLAGGVALKRKQILYRYDRSSGGGLLWSMTFYNGWGLETLFGYYNRTGDDISQVGKSGPADSRIDYRDERDARYLAPIWAKKNFRYPKLISPFVAGGIYWFDGSHLHEQNDFYFGQRSEKKIMHGVYPVVGAGVELFPARFFRPRIEVRHFFGPDLTALGNVFRTNTTFYSLGVLTSW